MAAQVVEFKFSVGDKVQDPLGGIGIVAMLGQEQTTDQYYVKYANGQGCWWTPDCLELAKEHK